MPSTGFPDFDDRRRMWQLVFGIWVSIASSATSVYGFLSPVLKDAPYHWSQEDLAWRSSIAGLAINICCLGTGAIYDRFGPQWCLRLGALGIFVGFGFMALQLYDVIPLTWIGMVLVSCVGNQNFTLYESGSFVSNVATFSKDKGTVMIVEEALGGAMLAAVFSSFLNEDAKLLVIVAGIFASTVGLVASLFMRKPVLGEAFMPWHGHRRFIVVYITVIITLTMFSASDIIQSFTKFSLNVRYGIGVASLLLTLSYALLPFVNRVPPLQEGGDMSITGNCSFVDHSQFATNQTFNAEYFRQYDEDDARANDSEDENNHDDGDQQQNETSDNNSKALLLHSSSSAVADNDAIAATASSAPCSSRLFPPSFDGRQLSTGALNEESLGDAATAPKTRKKNVEIVGVTNVAPTNTCAIQQQNLHPNIQEEEQMMKPTSGADYKAVLLSPELYLLAVASIAQWGVADMVIGNTPQIYQALNNGVLDKQRNAVYVSIAGVFRALGRIGVSLLDRYVAEKTKVLLLAPCLITIGVFIVVLPTPVEWLVFGFAFIGLGQSWTWAARLLVAKEFFSGKDFGKIWNTLYVLSLWTPFAFDVGLFAKLYDDRAHEQGTFPHCNARSCVERQLLVGLGVCFVSIAAAAGVLVLRRYRVRQLQKKKATASAAS